MKIAVFSTKPYDKEFLNQANRDAGHELAFFESALLADTVELASGYEGVCAFVNDSLNAEVLEKLSQLKIGVVALRCAGYNNVDLPAAKRLGIKIFRVPGYSPESVAEHAVALILTLNRKTHKAYNRIRESNFSLDKLIGFNLFGKTVGVIGTGQIGTAFCKIMRGFGCRILAYGLVESAAVREMGGQYVSLDELYRESDIISLHCPLTPETQHLINENAFDSMKNGVMVINTSRGKLIHTGSVIKALKARKIGYLGIDVYEQEENLFFHDFSESIIEDDLLMRLISFPNVLITSHQAFLTQEALEEIASTTLLNFEGFSQGEALPNEIVAS
jgi:D-lactate dehydrogenase